MIMFSVITYKLYRHCKVRSRRSYAIRVDYNYQTTLKYDQQTASRLAVTGVLPQIKNPLIKEGFYLLTHSHIYNNSAGSTTGLMLSASHKNSATNTSMLF